MAGSSPKARSSHVWMGTSKFPAPSGCLKRMPFIARQGQGAGGQEEDSGKGWPYRRSAPQIRPHLAVESSCKLSAGQSLVSSLAGIGSHKFTCSLSGILSSAGAAAAAAAGAPAWPPPAGDGRVSSNISNSSSSSSSCCCCCCRPGHLPACRSCTGLGSAAAAAERADSRGSRCSCTRLQHAASA